MRYRPERSAPRSFILRLNSLLVIKARVGDDSLKVEKLVEIYYAVDELIIKLMSLMLYILYSNLLT